ncbi:putative DNA-directed RNA polymerase III subunit Rpc31 [Lyophyllum shimeji]|uniref:DNA-directed RNA polymerase III subunit Rpc31 n=1 Tax=Lyophyllum shimeji TaxID=47721 RepID=A0A9P3UTJ3_LYOSH|nr:putative DNA-directed RNA polymerase III subunit Rpc31 [Lyophyllum shimeji]
MSLRKPNRLAKLPRYSDKYRPSVAAQPTLKRKDLNEAFFPPLIFDSYFNPKRKRKIAEVRPGRPRMNLDEMEGEEEEEKSAEERSEPGSPVEEDYDVDEEYDNDYAENYFDNGEADDVDDLGGGIGDEAGADYD